MNSSKEQQGEIRKPSSVINEKKQKKTIEWETRDFFKKIVDNKEKIHGKIGTIKTENDTGIKEAEDIKKK